MQQYFQLTRANTTEGIIYAANYLKDARAIWWQYQLQSYRTQGGFYNSKKFETEFRNQIWSINVEKIALDQLTNLT